MAAHQQLLAALQVADVEEEAGSESKQEEEEEEEEQPARKRQRVQPRRPRQSKGKGKAKGPARSQDVMVVDEAAQPASSASSHKRKNRVATPEQAGELVDMGAPVSGFLRRGLGVADLLYQCDRCKGLGRDAQDCRFRRDSLKCDKCRRDKKGCFFDEKAPMLPGDEAVKERDSSEAGKLDPFHLRDLKLTFFLQRLLRLRRTHGLAGVPRAHPSSWRRRPPAMTRARSQMLCRVFAHRRSGSSRQRQVRHVASSRGRRLLRGRSPRRWASSTTTWERSSCRASSVSRSGSCAASARSWSSGSGRSRRRSRRTRRGSTRLRGWSGGLRTWRKMSRSL